jgi:hypothetical protein
LGASLFGEYVKQYYGNDTVGSFYVMENDAMVGTFSCGFFAKKGKRTVIVVPREEDDLEGAWDSFNTIDIAPDKNGFIYNLNTTILIEMGLSKKGINLTGYLKKSVPDNPNIETREKIIQDHNTIITILAPSNNNRLDDRIDLDNNASTFINNICSQDKINNIYNKI